jgi:hypothetical protein
MVGKRIMAKADEDRIVRNDLKSKLRLEAQFNPKVRALFKRMVSAHKRSVIETGLPLNAESFLQDWTDMLEAHYKKVQESFVGAVIPTQKTLLTGFYIKQDEVEEEDVAAAMAAALLLWRANQAPTQARFITDTNAKNIQDAMDTARSALIDEGEEVSDVALSRVSSRFLTRDFQGRTPGIVMTETQAAAEATKIMEATTLSGIDPVVVATGAPLPVTETTKKWRTVGDTRVRQIHVDANGQIKRLSQPFEVGGELLRFPGDSGLGATPKNTANCRCSSVYRI